MKKSRFILPLFLFGLLVLLALAAWGRQKIYAPLLSGSSSVEFRVAPGSGSRAVGEALAGAGADINPWFFVLVSRFSGTGKTIKAGPYELEPGENLLDILQKLQSGKVAMASITFIEGWTFRQMRERMTAHPGLTHNTQGLGDQQLLGKLGLSEKSPEGLFFPDTYRFEKHSGELELLRAANIALKKRLDEEWSARARNLPYQTPYEALIMASIVEKETGRDSDRSLVAAVFANRLRQGMRLQTDPTVIYGLGEQFDGNLRKIDLLTDTPYNTYTRAGLPPTPIAMPGLASLQATLHPDNSDVLYFVSRNDGTTHFSRSLAEHNDAVNRYQRRGQR